MFGEVLLAGPGVPRSIPAAMSIADKQQQLLEELALFQDWTERYEYVIGLGKKLLPMPEGSKDPDHLIKGCQSQVWLDACLADGKVRFTADSDSLITKGMIALFVRVLDDEMPDDILTADMGFIDRTGLKEHLAPTRANALNLMATQMKQRALSLATSGKAGT
jgi:cysteine desulfuration protein SufE